MNLKSVCNYCSTPCSHNAVETVLHMQLHEKSPNRVEDKPQANKVTCTTPRVFFPVGFRQVQKPQTINDAVRRGAAAATCQLTCVRGGSFEIISLIPRKREYSSYYTKYRVEYLNLCVVFFFKNVFKNKTKPFSPGHPTTGILR